MIYQDTLPKEIKDKLGLYLVHDVSYAYKSAYKSNKFELEEIIFINLPDDQLIEAYKSRKLNGFQYTAKEIFTYEFVISVDYCIDFLSKELERSINKVFTNHSQN